MKDKDRKFNFCIEDMIQQNINEKMEVTFRSLSRYLSIPDEDKEKLIEEAKLSTLPPNSFSDRTKKKRKRLA